MVRRIDDGYRAEENATGKIDREKRTMIDHDNDRLLLSMTRRPEYLGQILAAMAVSLGPFSAGLGKGYSSPAIASIQQQERVRDDYGAADDDNNNNNNHVFGYNPTGDEYSFPLNGQQASWLASLSLLGALFGAPFGGVAVKWGRRKTLLMTGLPLTVCWLTTVYAFTVEIMFVTAFASGFLVAIVQLTSQIYVSEIASPRIRGRLSALLKVMGHVGMLVAFVGGAFLNWRQLAGMISLAPAAMCFAMWKMPESPGWLILRGKDTEAERALRWLRGNKADLTNELASLHEHVAVTSRSRTITTTTMMMIITSMTSSATRPKPHDHHHEQQQQLRHCRRVVSGLRKPTLIACGLMFFQRFSGVNAFNFYIVTILRQTFDGNTNPHWAAVTVAVVQLLSSLLSGLLVDRIGRLPLLIVSSVLMSLALASFGSFSYYETVNVAKLPQFDWIPLLCVLIFTIAYSLGINPISWLIISELFPLEQRGYGIAIATTVNYLCAFVGVKTFVDFQEMFQLYGTFWLYAAVTVTGLCFVVLYVPETNGRDLAEIDKVR